MTGDRVQHDRGDHFARTDSRLQKSWNKGPERAANNAEHHDHQDCERQGGCSSTEEKCRCGATETADRELTRATDIENASAEGHRNTKTDKDERDGCDYALYEWPHRSCPDGNIAIRGESLSINSWVAERPAKERPIRSRNSAEAEGDGPERISSQSLEHFNIGEEDKDCTNEERSKHRERG